MTIAIDFDGTIVTHAYPAIGRELPGATATLRRLQHEGHRLILWTVREGDLLDEAVAYCRAKGVEFFAVNENYSGETLQPGLPGQKACRKINADIYIDDRNAGGFPGWEAIYTMLHDGLSFSRYYSELSGQGSRSAKKSLLRRIFG